MNNSENYSKDLLRTGVIEARAGNIETARRYLDRAIYMTGSYDAVSYTHLSERSNGLLLITEQAY